MSNSQNMIKYVKHNKVRIKADSKREEITNIFEEIKGKSTGMKGFMVMDDLQDLQEPSYLHSGREKMIWIHFTNQI